MGERTIMILDKDGKEIKDSNVQHKFGMFNLPPDCHIKGFGSFQTEPTPTPFAMLKYAMVKGRWVKNGN